MELKIKQEQLEELKEASKKNDNGLANFKLIENKDGEEHFIFRVVCQRFHTTKGIIKQVSDVNVSGEEQNE